MAERRPRSWPSISGSEKERATEAFRRLEDLTRLISDWVWETDGENKFTYVSERIIDRLGLHPVQVIGKTFDDIGIFRLHDGGESTPPDFRRPFRDKSFEAVGFEEETRHFSVSGLPRFSEETGEFAGATGIAKDITELIRVERANVRLADAIEVLSGYFALYDEDDRLVISNARFRQLNKDLGDVAHPGSLFEDLLRAEVSSGRYPEAVDSSEDWIKRRLARRQRTSGPFEIEAGAGRWLYVDEERLPDGGTLMMARDITDMKRAMEALKKSITTHRDFAANVAHKLRTPLAVLRANLDSLGSGKEVQGLKNEVDTLARMVEQLLTLTRYEHFILPDDAKCDLYGITVDVVSSLAPLAIKEERSLELDGDSGVIMIHGDGGAIEHAVRNLIENAIKYSARGSAVEIKLSKDPSAIRISDQGRGIPLEERPRLFEKFTRTDRRGAGAGLGLHIVKTISDIHDAQVSIGHSASGGAEFSLVFPPFDDSAKRKAAIK